MMVRPSSFGYNEQTAGSNAFQSAAVRNREEISETAKEEFDGLVKILKAVSVRVYVFEDLPEVQTPDAVFPNNWISFQPDGSVILYPMLAPNRREERRLDIPEQLRRYHRITRIIDLTDHEKENKFLEGTGSIVFDHNNRIAYACRSPRTDEGLFRSLCRVLEYEPVVFNAYDRKGREIYHTNVMMAVGDGFSVICTGSIPERDRRRVTGRLEKTGHEVVELTMDQMEHFAGNMIQLKGNGQNYLVMSATAHQILSPDQLRTLEKFSRLLHAPLDVIETYGGGSARCMIAGVHLPLKST